MDIKKFVLSYYETATENFHITKVTRPTEALKLHTHSYFQVYYILHGKLTHHIEDTYALLSHSDVFILPPDISHYIESDDDTSTGAENEDDGKKSRKSLKERLGAFRDGAKEKLGKLGEKFKKRTKEKFKLAV